MRRRSQHSSLKLALQAIHGRSHASCATRLIVSRDTAHVPSPELIVYNEICLCGTEQQNH